jgi:hypothetical protein
MSERRELSKNVYRWSSLQTGEARQFNKEEYYPTDAWNKGLVRLGNTESILLGITGLQGTGKTSALNALEDSLSAVLSEGRCCVRLKWSREWKQQLIGRYVLSDDNYSYRLLQTLLTDCPEKVNDIGMSPETLRYFLNERKQLQRSIKNETVEQKIEELSQQLDRIESELELPNNCPPVESLLGKQRLQTNQKHATLRSTSRSTFSRRNKLHFKGR